MKILLLEYITGGGMRQETLPSGLASDGELMLCAVVADLLAMTENSELIILRDDRLPLPSYFSHFVQTIRVTAIDSFRTVWKEWIGRCDAIWPIAPETGGILEQLCLDVEVAGKALLNCPSSAVLVATSKLNTARRLAEFGVPVVQTEILDKRKLPQWASYVVKPDDGVGCEGCRILTDAVQIQALTATEGFIVQPLLEGEPISLSVLFAKGRARLLSCNRQWIERDGEGFRLNGVTVNAIADHDGSLQMLAERIGRAMPELWGYVGIDLILTDVGPVILEINPRLTISYAGLRRATGENPAAWLLHLLITGQLPGVPTRAGKSVELPG